MTLLQALFLGLVQGVAEFFPISSSGHLSLFQSLFGLDHLNDYIFFDLVLHLGTLCSIIVVYKWQIVDLYCLNSIRLRQIAIATLPLFPIVFILKRVETFFDKPQYLGLFFLLTAAILYIGIRFGHPKTLREQNKNRWKDPLVIGMFQAFAVLPGVSRSGATISAARLAGWETQEAVVFSFLLAIPAILGGTALKILQFTTQRAIELPSVNVSHYIIGFFTAFLVGYATLKLLIQLASKEKFMYFVWYCLALGVCLILYNFF